MVSLTMSISSCTSGTGSTDNATQNDTTAVDSAQTEVLDSLDTPGDSI